MNDTDAREQAWQDYCARLPESVSPGSFSDDDFDLARGDFFAGYDAGMASQWKSHHFAAGSL